MPRSISPTMPPMQSFLPLMLPRLTQCCTTAFVSYTWSNTEEDSF